MYNNARTIQPKMYKQCAVARSTQQIDNNKLQQELTNHGDGI